MVEEIIQFIILIPAAILSLIAGIYLILRGKNKLDKGMICLGTSYVLMICFFIVWGFKIADQAINYTIMYVVYMGVNFFTKFTFHKNQKGIFKYIVIFTTIVYILLIIPKIFFVFKDFTSSYNGKVIDNTFSIIWAVIVFGWLTYSGIKSYNQIKNKKVQPWIKKRLLLVIYSAFVEMFISVPDLIDIFTGRIFHDFVFYVQIILIATIMVMQFFAWIMPKRLKTFFNRGYIMENKIEIELNDEEIIKQMTEGYENK